MVDEILVAAVRLYFICEFLQSGNVLMQQTLRACLHT